jgi:hypothetical protein
LLYLPHPLAGSGCCGSQEPHGTRAEVPANRVFRRRNRKLDVREATEGSKGFD